LDGFYDDALRDDRRSFIFDALKSEFIPVEQFRNRLLVDLAPRALGKAS
jgi:hypothetical protein